MRAQIPLWEERVYRLKEVEVTEGKSPERARMLKVQFATA